MPTRIGFTIVAVTALSIAQTVDRPVRSVTDPGAVTTRQAITPAGVPTVFQGRVYGVAFTDSPSELYVLGATHVYKMDWKANRVIENVPLGAAPGLQGLRWDRRTRRALVGATLRGSGRSDNAATGQYWPETSGRF